MSRIPMDSEVKFIIFDNGKLELKLAGYIAIFVKREKRVKCLSQRNENARRQEEKVFIPSPYYNRLFRQAIRFFWIEEKEGGKNER